MLPFTSEYAGWYGPEDAADAAEGADAGVGPTDVTAAKRAASTLLKHVRVTRLSMMVKDLRENKGKEKAGDCGETHTHTHTHARVKTKLLDNLRKHSTRNKKTAKEGDLIGMNHVPVTTYSLFKKANTV